MDLGRMLPRLVGPHVKLVLRPDATAATVLADLSQIEQIFLNLAVNARDAMPQGGHLLLQTADVRPSGKAADGRAAHVAIIVRDSGTGMDEATRARIFEPFFTTKAAGQGTGLGLSTVDGIVQQSGGSIAVDSAPGRGTTFRIELPLADTARTLAPAARAPAARGSDSGHPDESFARAGPPLTVLVVDDDAQIRHVLRDLLEAAGHRVLEAGNGNQALGALRRVSAGLVLCDMLMPEKEGIETCTELRRLHPGLPFIAMSGAKDGANYLRIALKLGASASLAKPFSRQELLAAIAQATVRPRETASQGE
jgi:CheY-like chemotaxis protein